QLKIAVRTLPTCSAPVGLGAKRTRTLRVPHHRNRVDRNGFATSKLADAFVGLPFDADAIDRDAERFCQLRAHRVDVRRELRPRAKGIVTPPRISGPPSTSRCRSYPVPTRPVAAGLAPPRLIASATTRSSGVVILMFDASPGTMRTAWPACSASDASSVASFA